MAVILLFDILKNDDCVINKKFKELLKRCAARFTVIDHLFTMGLVDLFKNNVSYHLPIIAYVIKILHMDFVSRVRF